MSFNATAAKEFVLGGAKSAAIALGSAAQTPYLMPVFVGVGVLVIIAIIVFVALQYAKSGAAAHTLGPIDLWQPGSSTVVSRTDTKKYMTGTWTLSFYVRIDAVPDMRAEIPFLTWPGTWAIHYNPAQEQLVWLISPTPDGSFGASSQAIPIPDVPLQRWTQVTLVQEGRSLDMYVNGVLKKSDQLANLPKGAAGSITIVPNNIMGQAALIQLWNRRLNGGDIAANYAATSDSQGRPLLGPGFLQALKGVSIPNLFCPSGNCSGTSPSAQPSQTWEFPYA